MRVTLFTGNQVRHARMVWALSEIVDELYVVQECSSIFPLHAVEAYHRSQVMERYWQRVIAAEREVFGEISLGPPGVRSLPIVRGDLGQIEFRHIKPALTSDAYIVFGTGLIKGALCDFLMDHRAVNVHMGILPQYRGNSCNFWALYAGHPEMVGATVHLLTTELDSGPILFHALPKVEAADPFLLGMKAVQAVQQAVVHYLSTREFSTLTPVPQAKDLVLHHTKSREFTDEVALAYLENLPSPEFIEAALRARNLGSYVHPFVGR